MTTIYWGTVWAQTDIIGLWVRTKVRPWPYWFLRRLQLFAGIVWRRIDTRTSARLDWRAAWAISEGATGLVGPVNIHRGRAVKEARP